MELIEIALAIISIIIIPLSGGLIAMKMKSERNANKIEELQNNQARIDQTVKEMDIIVDDHKVKIGGIEEVKNNLARIEGEVKVLRESK